MTAILGNPTTSTDGSWTPRLGASVADGTHTYSTQTGWYMKVGCMVFAGFYVILSSVDAAISGNLRIKDLPFPAADGDSFPGTICPVSTGCTVSGVVAFRVLGNSDEIFIAEVATDGSAGNLASTALGATPAFHGIIFYMI